MSKVQHILFEKLKRLQGLEISFPETGVVAIMGANGIGKSTILHAMACLYQPDSKINKPQETYKWSRYFIPHEKNLWMGSSATVRFYGETDSETYSKASDRWTPKYSRRKSRYVRFIGIGDYYPHLEKEKYHTHFNFSTSVIESKKREQLILYASHILNRQYTDVRIATRTNGTQRQLWFVETSSGSYTSYYMGGGEQKVFHILDAFLDAPRGALILIEEIEILMHDHALRRLLGFMTKVATEKALQVVFSTHWTGIASCQKDISIRTLAASGDAVRCIEGFDASSVYNITGNPADRQQIEVWVEDTVSQRIIEQIASEMEILQSITPKIFGSANNSFAIAAAIVLSGQTEARMIVIDGDKYVTHEDKMQQMRKTLSGTSVQEQQESAVSLITQYAPSSIFNPEHFLRSALLDADGLASSPIAAEYRKFLKNNISITNSKAFVMDLATEFHKPKSFIENILVDHASKQTSWGPYTKNVREHLRILATELGIVEPQSAKPEPTAALT